ncbi:MAG: YdeI family protein [Thermoleophilia bacterium]
MADDPPTLSFADAAAFDAWLAAHHGDAAGVWLRMARKGSGIRSLTSDEAVDVGLCWGWISGLRRAGDESHYLQRYVPRRPRSAWSRVNVRRVEALMAAGRMRPPGLAEVEAARADGRWEAAYESQRSAAVPDDLAAALAARPRAARAFEALGRTDRYAAILPLLRARTPAGRARRLGALLDRLEA